MGNCGMTREFTGWLIGNVILLIFIFAGMYFLFPEKRINLEIVDRATPIHATKAPRRSTKVKPKVGPTDIGVGTEESRRICMQNNKTLASRKLCMKRRLTKGSY